MQPTSLMGHILKVKYYPNSGFLNAQLGSNPLMIWKIIWSAQNLLQIGLKWKVGLRKRINIWDEC